MVSPPTLLRSPPGHGDSGLARRRPKAGPAPAAMGQSRSSGDSLAAPCDQAQPTQTKPRAGLDLASRLKPPPLQARSNTSLRKASAKSLPLQPSARRPPITSHWVLGEPWLHQLRPGNRNSRGHCAKAGVPSRQPNPRPGPRPAPTQWFRCTAAPGPSPLERVDSLGQTPIP